MICGCCLCAFGWSVGAANTGPDIPALNWEPRSDWLSVKDHGAVGDGKTDDTAALQQMLDQHCKSATTIYFPPGTYRITRTLNLPNANPKTAKPYKLLLKTGFTADQKVPRALSGFSLVGHGRASKLVWDGNSGYPLLQSEGMTGSRIVGLDLDGSNRASIGFYWCSKYTFGTGNRFRHCAFRNFPMNGFYLEWHEPTRALADAETSFENCLFDNCGTGVSFQQFNDYNFTFDGCEFRRCGTGILSSHGNFFARNCHFERSTRADIRSYCEHGSTVRRCTSLGSNRFIEHSNVVSPLVVEGCTIRNWRDPAGAILVNGAPVMLFDNTFINHAIPVPLAKGAVRFYNERNKVLILSENRIVKLNEQVASADGRSEPAGMAVADQALPLSAEVWPERTDGGRVYTIPAGQRQGLRLSPDQHFLKSEANVSGKVFDAVRDFGAKANNSTDDSVSIQKAIDAARDHGQGAIAYLPAGRYAVKQTLRLTGGDYSFGGAGIYASQIEWRGPADAPTVRVAAPNKLTISNLGLSRRNPAPDILQENADGESLVVYDGVAVSSARDRDKLDEAPVNGGLECRGLGPRETVLATWIKGHLRFVDCGRANILVPISYYGSVTLEGKSETRDGLCGLMTRLGVSSDFNIKDNHSLVISGYYNESGIAMFRLAGADGNPAGRVTVQGSNISCRGGSREPCLSARDYAGQVFIGPIEFIRTQAGRMALKGERAVELFLVGNTFYHTPLDMEVFGPSKCFQLGSWPVAIKDVAKDEVKKMFTDNLPADRLAELAVPLDDLRRLGALDLKLNYPEIYADVVAKGKDQ